MSRMDDFFRYARERESIRRRRESGAGAPWTDDPVLKQYRFCNVHRENDAVTKWFRDNVREQLRDSPDVILATVLFRWFNLVRTGEWLFTPDASGFSPFEVYLNGAWDWQELGRQLKRALPSGPYTTGAYMIKTPTGMDKVTGVLWCVDQLAQSLARERAADGAEFPHTLQAATHWLQGHPFMGPFMAYEVVTDLRHTHWLENAPDILTWANPGPGAARGLDRLAGDTLGTRDRNNLLDVKTMNVEMRALLEASRDSFYWPQAWGAWEMREVEHTLCEFDKYERARLGQGRPKQVFRKGEGN